MDKVISSLNIHEKFKKKNHNLLRIEDKDNTVTEIKAEEFSQNEYNGIPITNICKAQVVKRNDKLHSAVKLFIF